jgi:hypothetical protein
LGLIRSAVAQRLTDLGLETDEIAFFDSSSMGALDRRLPRAAVYLAGVVRDEEAAAIEELLADSVPILPAISSTQLVGEQIPEKLKHINVLELGDDGQGLERFVSLIFETFRLLRKSRRLFISYKRTESQPLAERLYDELDRRGFDVFIDVRSVPPGDDFQAELWHRMADSDVIVLIDTPGFRMGRWTKAELAQANATNIQILHLLWPGQKEDAGSAFSHFRRLLRADFWWLLPGRGKYPRRKLVSDICSEVERLRARAIAARHRHLVDNVCDAAKDVGLQVSLQPDRWILVEPLKKPPLAIIPAIGVPTADQINQIHDTMMPSSGGPNECWIIYDNRGILERWLTHLDWLDTHLPLRTLRVSAVPDALKALVA